MGPKYSVLNTSWVGSLHSTSVGATNQPSLSSAVPPNVDRSVTSPYWMAATVAASRSRRPPSQMERGTYARDAAEHFWPWYSYAPRTSAVCSASTSALACAKTKSLPPVSPTTRGYDRYRSMWLPTSCHRCRNVAVEPVKWMPARSGSASTTSETANPSPVTRVMTLGGSPAASKSRMVKCAANCWVGDGFQMTVLPMSAGADGRLPAIAVKLNGVIAYTKPSSGRWSNRFHIPLEDSGCSPRIRCPNAALKRRKSISSQAASISAWYTDLDWPRMVAALSVSRHPPASSSAARRKTAARSLYGNARQPGAASFAAATAAAASARVALPATPST